MSGIAAAMVTSAVIGGVASNRAANKASDAQDRAIAANAWQGEIAKDQYEDYKSVYRPLEHKLAADAANMDSPEAYDKAAAEAQASVSTQLDLAKDRMRRTYGLDPSSGAAQAATMDMEIKGAAMGANAQNKARQNLSDKSFARQMDVAGLGKGLVANASNGLASAAAASGRLADSAAAQANATASGVGSMVGGLFNAASKVDWGKVGGIFGGGSPDVVVNSPSTAGAYLPDSLRGGQ